MQDLRLYRINLPWVGSLWNQLKLDEAALDALPNAEGRRFSVWQAAEVISGAAWHLLEDLNIDLSVYRNFKLSARTKFATMMHRDHPTDSCFAINICIRGSLKVHFYDDIEPMFNQQSSVGSNPVYYTMGQPRETYAVGEGELFIMDTHAIHQADTSDCKSTVLLSSFIASPQYRYEDAVQRLAEAGVSLS